MWLQNDNLLVVNIHFMSFAYNLCSVSFVKTFFRCFKCFFMMLKKIKILLRYTKQKTSLYSIKIMFIIVWNVAGAFVSLKDMTRNSNFSHCILNAVFETDNVTMQTCQYSETRLIFKSILIFLIIFSSSWICDNE